MLPLGCRERCRGVGGNPCISCGGTRGDRKAKNANEREEEGEKGDAHNTSRRFVSVDVD